MILVDTSAWVEFLRDTRSSVCAEVDRLLGEELAVTGPVVMEVLAGARDDRHLHDLRGLVGRATLLHCRPVDFGAAASMYRTCRQRGRTVRKTIDCLIAAIAVRHSVPLLHADKDFDALETHAGLVAHRP